jgi:hypothetical protein
MSVYKKLQSARIKLLNTKLTKSGLNKFAGFQYFELDDIVPSIQRICDEVGLCGVVSFTPDLAYLNIYDVDSEGVIVFSSPMSTAALKGVHEIQNLGAVQSYLRRYLWIAAFEICEHDALDAVAGADKAAPKPTPKPQPKPEVKIEVKAAEGIGPLNVPAAPSGDTAEWLSLVRDSSLLALGFVESAQDVMQLFKLNKTLFDAVKNTDEAFFKSLMDEFAKVKKQFEGTTNG